MKKLLIGFIYLGMNVIAFADDYTYTINTYQILPDLTGTQSMLVTGQGGGGGFYAKNYSSVTVESTSTLGQGTGGLWEINLIDYSKLNFLNGELGKLIINNNATADLQGGFIQQIWSYQQAPDPHIKLYYSGDLPIYNETTDILTGLWGNGDPFSIYLHDTGYNVYGNFEFIEIPEPASLALLTLGSLLIRRKS